MLWRKIKVNHLFYFALYFVVTRIWTLSRMRQRYFCNSICLTFRLPSDLLSSKTWNSAPFFDVIYASLHSSLSISRICIKTKIFILPNVTCNNKISRRENALSFNVIHFTVESYFPLQYNKNQISNFVSFLSTHVLLVVTITFYQEKLPKKCKTFFGFYLYQVNFEGNTINHEDRSTIVQSINDVWH